MFTHNKVNPADINTSKGQRTWEWKFADGAQITVYKRQKGEKFAEHFHKGDDTSKNPELFLLVEGAIKFIFINKENLKTETILDCSDGNVHELIIYPNILHSAEALENCTYIERRLVYFDKNNPDTYLAEDFFK
jgi:hypothetical protein